MGSAGDHIHTAPRPTHTRSCAASRRMLTGAQQWRRLRDNGHIWMRACMDESKNVCMCTMLASPSRSCSLFQAARRSAATAAPRFESYCTPSSAGWPRFWGELAMALGREPCKSIFIQFPSPPPHLLKPILSREHASRAASFRGSRLLARSALDRFRPLLAWSPSESGCGGTGGRLWRDAASCPSLYADCYSACSCFV